MLVQQLKTNNRINTHSQTRPPGFSLKPKLLTLAIAQALAFQTAQAASIEVTSNADDGTNCTLREAIATVNAGTDQSNGCVIDDTTDPLGTDDTINFATAGSTITLADSQQLSITSSVTINGDGVTVDANNASRVMHISGLGTSADLNQLTITGGGNA